MKQSIWKLSQGLSLGLALALSVSPRIARAGDSESSDNGSKTKLNPAQQRKIAGQAGVGVGLGWAHGGLGLTPELLAEIGMRVRLGKGALGVHLRGGWQRYSTSGSGSLPCADDTVGPCISSEDGNYDWTLVEHAGRVELPLTYRIFNEDRRVTPYLTVAPGLYMLSSRATTYDLTNTQFSAKFGIYGAAGAQLVLGPGGLFAEAGYQWSGLDHRITGNADVGAIRFAVGYRFAF